MTIYSSGQLGSEQQCVELLQIGSLAITKVSAAVMESFTNNFQVLGLPYVFKSREHTFKVLDGEIGRELLTGRADLEETTMDLDDKRRIRGGNFVDPSPGIRDLCHAGRHDVAVDVEQGHVAKSNLAS